MRFICLFLLVHSLGCFGQITFTLSGNVCTGDSRTVTAIPGGNIPISYTWSSSGIGPVIASPNSSVTTISFPVQGNFSVILSVNYLSGSDVYSLPVTVSDTPTINTSQTDFTTCITNNSPSYSKPVAITASGATTYSWLPLQPPPFVPGNGQVATVRPASSTCYTVTGFSGGCSSSNTACVMVIPQFSISVIPNPAIRCLPDSVNLQIQFIQSFAQAPFTYSWTENGNPATLDNYFSPKVKAFPANNTTYTLEVMDIRNCISLPAPVTVSVQICNDVREQSREKEIIHVFPNPSNGKIFISGIALPATITIIDLHGRQSKILSDSSAFDLSTFPEGIYLVRIPLEKGDAFRKIIKQ